MTIVGLTGSLGTGKSTVASLFRDLGAYVIDWDELARNVVRPRSKVWKQLVDYYGMGILNENLSINRQKLADVVFSDKRKLKKLNQIIHPKVFEQDEKITKEIQSHDPNALIIKDIPLLFEVSRPIPVDKIIVVSATEETQLRRLEEKGMSRQDARRRIESQMSLDEKVKSADFVIDNDGPLEETRKQVEAIYSLLKRKESRQTTIRR